MRKRNKSILLRLTQAEMEVLTRKAKEAKMPREAFIRRVLNGAKIIAKPPADYYKLIVEVRKVGSNLNQVVKRAQSLDFIDIPALQKVLAEIHETEGMLWETFQSDGSG